MNKPLAISIISALSLTFAASSSFANDDEYSVTAADIRQICQEETQGDENPAQAIKECMEEYGFGENNTTSELAKAPEVEEEPAYEEPAETYEEEDTTDDDGL